MRLNPLNTVLRRHLAVWLLVLTTVFGTLAPTLSHVLVLALGDSTPMMEVCSSTGIMWVAAPDSTDSPDGPESTPTRKICPFCLLFTDRVAPPPHPLVHLFVVPSEFKVPTVRQAVFFLTPFALTPPPRGPPASL